MRPVLFSASATIFAKRCLSREFEDGNGQASGLEGDGTASSTWPLAGEDRPHPAAAPTRKTTPGSLLDLREFMAAPGQGRFRNR